VIAASIGGAQRAADVSARPFYRSGLRGARKSCSGWARRSRRGRQDGAGQGAQQDVPLLYWRPRRTGLAISASKSEPEMSAAVAVDRSHDRRAVWELDAKWAKGASRFQVFHDQSGKRAHGREARGKRRNMRRSFERSSNFQGRTGLTYVGTRRLMAAGAERAEFQHDREGS